MERDRLAETGELAQRMRASPWDATRLKPSAI
jgi:hypothetical protein